MRCPVCSNKSFKVIYVIRVAYKNHKIRRKECLKCTNRITTVEEIKCSQHAKQLKAKIRQARELSEN